MQNSSDEKNVDSRLRKESGLDEVILSELHTLLLSPAVPSEVKKPIKEALMQRDNVKKQVSGD